MPIEGYAHLVGEEIVDAYYNKVELVDLAWGREIHLALNWNEEPMEGDEVNDRPIPILKPTSLHKYYQI